MRRIILLALVAALAFFGYTCVTDGVINDDFNVEISEFEKVEKSSEDMTKELAEYNEKNEKTFELSKQKLASAIKNYENAKSEYEDTIAILGIDNSEEEKDIVEATKTAYQIDFLWATIGNYATKEGIKDLDLVFVESDSKAPSKAGYTLADLKFTVSGDYILIANFLYDLEDDDRLAFEINDYYMVKDKASFTVKNVPIESSTLSSFSSSSSSESGMNSSSSSNSTNTTSSKGNSLRGNTIKTDNTVN